MSKQNRLGLALWGAGIVLMASSGKAQKPPAAQGALPAALVGSQLDTMPPKPPGLRLQLILSKPQYAQGEPIEVTLRYTYAGGPPLRVEMMTYDRSGRIPEFTFHATDEKGVAVPDPTPMSISMGGIRMVPDLPPNKPLEQKVLVNEWLRFDKPGRYLLTLRSTAVTYKDLPANNAAQPVSRPLVLDSAPIPLVITPPDATARLQKLVQAQTDLTLPDNAVREATLRDLRFLVDRRAIPLLVQGLQDAWGNSRSQAWFGLRSFADMTPVQAELLRTLDNPNFIPNKDTIGLYVSLLTEAELRNQGEMNAVISPRFQEVRRSKEALIQDHIRRKQPAPAAGAQAVLGADGMTELMRAVEAGDVAQVRMLVHPETINTQDAKGNTALMRAAMKGKGQLVTLLLEAGARPELAGEYNITPLMWAEQWGDIANVKRMLALGMDVNGDKNIPGGPLMYASSWPEIMKLLLDKGADIHLAEAGQKALLGASCSSNIASATFLLARGMKIDYQDTQGFSALGWAAWNAQPDIIPFLIAHGADRELRTPHGQTPLMLALTAGRSNSPVALLDAGVDVNTADNDGLTPLMAAVRYSNDTILDRLLSRKVNVNARTLKGVSALMWAAQGGKADRIKLLLAHDADLNAKDAEGNTALAWAIRSKQPAAEQALREAGAK